MNKSHALFLRSISCYFTYKLAVTLALLSLAVAAGCKPSAPAHGQAFIVLKSGDVQPLADMPIVFLPEGFLSAFLSFQSGFRKDTDSSLSNLLAKNPPAKKILAEADANIEGLESKIAAAGKSDPRQQQEDIAKEVEAQIIADRKLIATQLGSEKQQLEIAKAELDKLKNSTQSLFEEKLNDQRKELDAFKKYFSKLEDLIREFDSAVAESNRSVEIQQNLNEKVSRRRAQIPSLVAKTLNSAIRDQRLQTPLIDENSYEIRIDYEEKRPRSGLGDIYIAPHQSLGKYGYYNFLKIPSELDSARTLPEAMQLVREWFPLEEQLKIGKADLMERLERRQKAATPWINLNADKIVQLRQELSLRASVGSGGDRRFSSSNLSEEWPPEAYKSAKDARDLLQVTMNYKEEALGKQTLKDFAAELTRRAEENLEAFQTKIRKLTGNIAALDASKAERIQTLNAAVAANTQQTISKLEGELKIAKEARAKYVAEIDAENQRKIRRDYLLSVRELINSSAHPSVRTDRIGDFKIPTSAEFVWASKARDNGEQFYWLRRVQQDATDKMLLSNSTISGSVDYEWLVNYTLR